MTWWLRLHARLIAARTSEGEDRRREEALNGLLLVSIAIAVFEAAIRVPAVLDGGRSASDHGTTLLVAILAGAAFCGLLALSRQGRQVWASWGILAAFYLVATWLFNAEGTEEPIAIILCTVSVVAAGVLLGSRVSLLVVAVLTVTLVSVTAVGSSGGDDLDIVGQLGVGGGLAALALVLSARTVEPQESVGQLLSAAQEVGLANAVLADLTVRELQVVRLIAAGRSNDEIASELFVSPRTVHTHVSNALRKTGCTNRTELAVLAISGTVRRQLSAAAKPVG